MTIKKLSKEVYDLIAAGEVVLAPVSVVKELVENAVDAGATRITVEMTAGGIDKIRVSDNGSGIIREEIELAFAPHATSKLSGVDDLERIETLGFRGEALASIAAVSIATMRTKTAAEKIGTQAVTEGGSPPLLSSVGLDPGTDITVEQLFFNIPARRKHLAAPRTEGRKITEYLMKAAVSRPDTAFRLISDGSMVFATLGNGDRLAAIAAAYGSKTAENLVSLHADSGAGMCVEGYISGPLGLRSNRKGQHYFVNGRPVGNAALETAVGRAYREFAEPGRFPVVFLFLSVPPDEVDVNVHPAKSEISFVDSRQISEFIEKSIKTKLESEDAIPRLKTHMPKGDREQTFNFKPESGSDHGNDENGVEKSETDNTLVSTSGGDGEKIEEVDINIILSTNHMGSTPIDGNISEDIQNEPLVYDNNLQSSSVSKNISDHFVSENKDYKYHDSLNIANLHAVVTLFATYILAADGETYYIIDQHAAHERVNYERFLCAFEERNIAMQALLTPYLFTPPASAGNLNDHTDFFAQLGYEIDEFGENTWAARTFPAFVSYEEGAAFLSECLAALGDEQSEPFSHAAAERIMMRACKASVKGNTTLSDVEITKLLEDLSHCRNPFSCPHGRPVFLKLTRTDIERMFKRG